MKPVTKELGQDLVKKLAEYFKSKCEVELARDVESQQDEIRITTPFRYFDSTPVEIWVSYLQNELTIHDDSWIYQYLRDYDISLKGKAKDHEIYEYCIDRARRGNFEYDLSSYRFCLRLADENIGKQLFDFAECLSMLTSLVLRKAAGIKQFTIKDRKRFRDINTRIRNEYRTSNVEVIRQIRVERIGWIDDWGSLIRRRDISRQVALQFVGGQTQKKIIQNTMIAKQLFGFLESWSDIPKENCIALFGGDRKTLAENNKILDIILGDTDEFYPVFSIDDFEGIRELLDDRLLLKRKTEKYLKDEMNAMSMEQYFCKTKLSEAERNMNIRDLLGKKYLIVRKLDPSTLETERLVEIVEIEQDLEDLSKLAQATYRCMEKLSGKYPIGDFGISVFSAPDLEVIDDVRGYKIPALIRTKASELIT